MIYEANGVRVWASDLDTNALLQAERTARSEVVIHPVALMADAHVGLGATVGSVIVTPSNALLPAAVGVDIGCGMIAVETDLEDIGNGQPLIVAFGRSVPSGVGKSHVKTTPRARNWMRAHPCPTDLKAIHDGLPERATAQIGSLGSGNHFLEVSTDGDGKVWVVVHSGSRGVGNELARFYIGRARELAQVKGIELEDRDLASLEDDEIEVMEIKGRDLVAGVPKTLELKSEEVREALAEPVNAVVESVRIALERTPPELAADIVDKGIVLVGGGSLLKNLDVLLREATGLPVMLAEDPLTAVAIGTGRTLEDFPLLKEIALRS